MNIADRLTVRWAALDAASDDERRRADSDRLLPYAETRALVARALAGEFRDDDMAEQGRRGGQRSARSRTLTAQRDAA